MRKACTKLTKITVQSRKNWGYNFNQKSDAEGGGWHSKKVGYLSGGDGFKKWRGEMQASTHSGVTVRKNLSKIFVVFVGPEHLNSIYTPQLSRLS